MIECTSEPGAARSAPTAEAGAGSELVWPHEGCSYTGQMGHADVSGWARVGGRQGEDGGRPLELNRGPGGLADSRATTPTNANRDISP